MWLPDLDSHHIKAQKPELATRESREEMQMEKPQPHVDKVDNAEGGKSESAREGLTKTALTLYGCKDGSVVSNPKDCRENNRGPNTLPDMTLI